METHGLDEDDDFYKLHSFNPTKEEAVTYFLPVLIAGETHELIRNDDVYGCEPKDLAAKYPPTPRAEDTGDRFFFTTCTHKKGRGKCARVAGAGTWTINTTKPVIHKGVKVGEVKNLSFRKNKKATGWVMEEYRCLLPNAVVGDEEKVLCKLHLAQNAPATAPARQESNAYKPPQEPAEPPAPVPQPKSVTMTATGSAHVQYKRQAPVAAADLSSSKKMRIPAPVQMTPDEKDYEDCPVWFTSAAAPVTSPAASMVELPDAPEADDDRFSCTMDELLGLEQEQTLPAKAENNMEQLDFHEGIEQLDFYEGIEQLDIDQLLSAPIDWDSILADSYSAAGAADLQTPSSQGQSQFISFAAVN
jgi:hypothetical protein